MKKTILQLIFSFLCINIINAQNTFDISFPTTEASRNYKCQRFSSIFNSKPKEVGFSIKRVNASLFLETNDGLWFSKLFKNSGDGIAIDVVSKDYYSCDKLEIENNQIRGTLLKPVYAQKVKSSLRKKNGNSYRILVGRLPSNLLKKELEFNILFLSDKNLCQYYTIYNLESYAWDLLDMGMYLDTLTYNTKEIKGNIKEETIIKTKTLKFKIPFEKNKSEYLQEDIRPLYDSLRLTDYNIKTININAYSSVEGSLERNIELQEQRSKSIAKALQSFQKPTIKTKISSSENWVEFFNDISDTKHQSLKKLSKSKIKQRLVGTLSKELEPFLKTHRKAVVELQLERKDKHIALTPNELLNKFNASITSDKLDEARELQNSIFEKINKKEISPDFLKKMEVPKQEKFVKIINKNAAFRFLNNIKLGLIVYSELQELEKLSPKNGEVKYNIAATKLKLWRYKAIQTGESEMKSQINALKNYNIDKVLIDRMLVNLNIIRAENLMRKRKYKEKDKAVTYIHNNYKSLSLSDYDYLSLAQFFSYYAKTDYAVELLKDKVKAIDTNENLLYYYLNLTIINNTLTQNEDYRTIMLNAYNMNNERYCKLFDPFDAGGVTFQLLENSYLRQSYCENCNN